MKKETLKVLAELQELKRKLHNDWVDQSYPEELLKKIRLVHKVFKSLEESERGKLKTKVPYEVLGRFLLQNTDKLSYVELHSELTAILFRNKKPKIDKSYNAL